MSPTAQVLAELQKIPWFSELEEEHLRQIAEISFVRRVKAGEVIFHEGDKQDHIYVVVDGRVALDMFIPHRGKIRFYTADQWDVIGWSGVTPTIHQRIAGAVAVLDSTMIATDVQKLRELCDQDHDLGYLVMRRLANVVAGRLVVTRLQLLDMFAEPVETKNDD
jgi:CRP/FNR family cyclic AMP-dependent transcriptional regulator